ncbi:hypothetical protein AMATHDRAFT_147229 [Amanita thiersii Skay4041]|uniref:N-acetyltransferase domain-containing protein n=1 Tax=Amanita thiersii Skay4041 TaxID=703135 RepID=A0A2A9NJZ8_9AGAR|nr:hypothetical protein AMATHDRAFT_147229 [Amanita thiersii Skay4041]
MTPKLENSYDFNFCFPVAETLENDRLKLVPFNPNIYTGELLTQLQANKQVFQYLPYGPFHTIDEFNDFFDLRFRRDPNSLLFIIYDKTKSSPGNNHVLAGTIGLLNGSVINLVVEIGHIMILPTFQRTHVTSNAVGLLLHYCLDVPSAGGLGLRRVAWQADAINNKSINAAERMGFRLEGILRWDRVLPPSRISAMNWDGVRKEDPKPSHPGRHTAMLSHCWDDWENGGRQRVDQMMARLA